MESIAFFLGTERITSGANGEETMKDIYREYYSRWAFKHPCARDFIAVVNDVVEGYHGNKFGPDMNWFFDQTLYGTGICDYRLASITNRTMEEESLTDSTLVETFYTSTVRVDRLGEVMLPVSVSIHFEDGTEEVRNWDGKARYHEWTFMGRGRITMAKVDPEYKIRMDVNFINNSVTTKPDPVPVKRITNKAIFAIQIFLSMLTL